jgi:PKHD-type hydroxylase
MLPIQQPPQFPFAAYNLQNIFNDQEFNQLQTNVNQLEYQPSVIGEWDEKTKSNTDISDTELRSSNIKWIPKNQTWGWLYKRLHDCIIRANVENWNFTVTSIDTEIQYSEYEASQNGHYTWHADMDSGDFSLRKLSVIVQLSSPEEYDGGVIEFFTGGNYETMKKPVVREKGLVTIFPSYMIHRVTPVTRGTRKSLVLWAGGCQFK